MSDSFIAEFTIAMAVRSLRRAHFIAEFTIETLLTALYLPHRIVPNGLVVQELQRCEMTLVLLALTAQRIR